MTYALDFKGRRNLFAQEIPSAVGMRGFYIADLDGEYDFFTYDFDAMVRAGTARPASFIGRRP